jgi:UDP-hydrolysing UDP-N-acetyl-D-glucosamine 2-epimerase
MTIVVRKVAIFTGTRADFGLLRELATLAQADSRVQLQLIASGTHLSDAHGSTVREITAAGLTISALVPIWGDDGSPVGVAGDMGAGVRDYAKVLAQLRPDVVVVLGDRLEALAMAIAATILQIPVAHIHGGEITEGAMDDSLRHAITKLSFLHFATTEDHRNRILQLGEQPDRVFNFGAPVLDAIEQTTLFSKDEIESRFGVRLRAPTLLLTFHPAAFDEVASGELLTRLLAAIDQLRDTRVIVTGTNSDIGSEQIREILSGYISENAERVDFVESFGQRGYLSIMKQVQAVVGNSSSTVLEAPLLGVPSVLVGDRQLGRPKSAGVLTPKPTTESILEALRTALSAEFQRRTVSTPSVFGSPGFARRTLDVLATFSTAENARKQFSDLRVS